MSTITTSTDQPFGLAEDEITIHPELPEDRRKPKRWIDSPRRSVLSFALLFAVAEAVGAFVSIPAQAALDAVFAFAAVNTAIFGFRTKRTAGLVMAGLFTDRLVTLTLPTVGISVTTRMGVIAAATIVIAYVATWVLSVDVTGGRNDEGFALRHSLVSRSFTSAVTVLSGFPIGWLAYEALKPGKLVVLDMFGSSVVPWVIAIAAICVAAFSEELLYRRLVAAMVQHTGQSQTPWVSAFIYGAAFLGTQNAAMVALMFVSGALFAWSCERTGTIKPVVAAHAIASLLLLVVLPN